jgi:DNA-binding IclR family transcriptional regulator
MSELDGVGVTKLAEELNISKSVVHNHLQTLKEGGYVVQDGDEYELGFQFLHLAGKKRKRHPLFKVAKNEVKILAEKTSQRVHLGTEEMGKCINLHKMRHRDATSLEFSYEGKREYMHTSSLGKSILAKLPEEDVERIVDQHGLPEMTENTITDKSELYDELEVIREGEYAVDDEESVKGLRCVGAPITGPRKTVIGSISVSGPKGQFKNDMWKERVPDLVVETSNMIELQIVDTVE